MIKNGSRQAGDMIVPGYFYGRKQGGRRGPRSRLRFARSALNSYSVALPVFSVLKTFLDCGPHMFPPVVGGNGGFKRLPWAHAEAELA